MKITCISASNTIEMGRNSASTKVCELIKSMIVESSNDKHLVDVLALMDYDLRPCTLCGHCGKNSQCIYNDGFNNVYKKITESDLIIFVVPFYSVIPSKLTILFEKLNEFLYCNWINDRSYVPPFRGIPVGIIGHGGMPQEEKVHKYYHEHLVTPVARTLKSLSFNVIPYNEEYSNGATFGLENENCILFDKPDDRLLPEIVQNYELIQETIEPYINKLLVEQL